MILLPFINALKTTISRAHGDTHWRFCQSSSRSRWTSVLCWTLERNGSGWECAELHDPDRSSLRCLLSACASLGLNKTEKCKATRYFKTNIGSQAEKGFLFLKLGRELLPLFPTHHARTKFFPLISHKPLPSNHTPLPHLTMISPPSSSIVLKHLSTLLIQSLPAALSLLTSLGNRLPAIIPVLLGHSLAGSCQPLFGRKLPDVPKLDGLILGVADQISCIALTKAQ